jgi:hypothetical protein
MQELKGQHRTLKTMRSLTGSQRRVLRWRETGSDLLAPTTSLTAPFLDSRQSEDLFLRKTGEQRIAVVLSGSNHGLKQCFRRMWRQVFSIFFPVCECGKHPTCARC